MSEEKKSLNYLWEALREMRRQLCRNQDSTESVIYDDLRLYRRSAFRYAVIKVIEEYEKLEKQE